jgi:hypothetical protein
MHEVVGFFTESARVNHKGYDQCIVEVYVKGGPGQLMEHKWRRAVDAVHHGTVNGTTRVRMFGMYLLANLFRRMF